MRPFQYHRARDRQEALALGGRYLASGTTLVDLLRLGVVTAPALVDLQQIGLTSIDEHEGGLRIGAMVRATVDDAEMARGVGIDTSKVSMFIFALGAFLAALGGVIGGAFLGIYPGLDFEVLPIAFAVVIIGGMGSLAGAAVGSMLVGLADNFGKALFPEVAYFSLYAPMVLILAMKPTGLMGRE